MPGPTRVALSVLGAAGMIIMARMCGGWRVRRHRVALRVRGATGMVVRVAHRERRLEVHCG